MTINENKHLFSVFLFCLFVLCKFFHCNMRNLLTKIAFWILFLWDISTFIHFATQYLYISQSNNNNVPIKYINKISLKKKTNMLTQTASVTSKVHTLVQQAKEKKKTNANKLNGKTREKYVFILTCQIIFASTLTV